MSGIRIAECRGGNPSPKQTALHHILCMRWIAPQGAQGAIEQEIFCTLFQLDSPPSLSYRSFPKLSRPVDGAEFLRLIRGQKPTMARLSSMCGLCVEVSWVRPKPSVAPSRGNRTNFTRFSHFVQGLNSRWPDTLTQS